MTQDEIEFAAKVHYGFLPERFSNDMLDVVVEARPWKGIGGDYCSVFPVGDNHLVLCICDAVGHGLASALFAARINTFVLSHMMHSRCPCELIEAMNQFFCQRLVGSGMYASFFSMVLDREKCEFSYAGAGHAQPVYYRRETGDIEFLQSATTILGVQHPLPIQCKVNRHPVAAGDRILLYTDGLVEVRNPGKQPYGTKRLAHFMQTHGRLDSPALSAALWMETEEFCAGRYVDDVLTMTVTLI